MWPHKNGLGIRLSYGIDGGGIVVVQQDENPEKGGDDDNVNCDQTRLSSKVDIPRGNDPYCVLNEVTGSYLELVMSQLSPEMIFGPRNHTTNKITNTYVPENILASYGVESQTLMSVVAYDPTFGCLFEVLDVRNRRSKVKAMAFVTGEIGNIFNISVIDSQIRDVQMNGSSLVSSVTHPDIAEPLQIDLSEPIKQIIASKTVSDVLPQYILIRTSLKVYLIRCYKSKSEATVPIILHVHGHISVNDLAGCDFVDVSFSPHDHNQFSIVDAKGNFGIWNILKPDSLTKFKRLTFAKSSTAKPTIEDSSELSSWKKICWELDNNHLLVISRSSVVQFVIDDNENLSSKKLVTSNTWSKIQDFRCIKENLFLLTSKELIWFSLSNSLERLMSWKHFLDDTDPSLKLHVTPLKGNRFVCLIFSEMHPLIFVYNFGLKGGKPISLHDPYVIRKRGENGNLKQVALYALADFKGQDTDEDSEFSKYALFQMTTDYCLSITTYSNENNLKMKSLESWKTRIQSDAKNHEFKRNALDVTKYTKAQVSKLINLMEMYERLPEDEQIESIRNYAFSLGEGVVKLNSLDGDSNQEYPSFLSLLDIAKDIPISIENVSEVDIMIEQLALFYEHKNIQVSSLINSSLIKNNKLATKSNSETDQNKNIEDILHLVGSVFSDKLLKKFNDSINLNKLSIILGTSLIKAKSKELSEFYNKSFEKLIETAPTSVKSLLEEWDVATPEINSIPNSIKDSVASQVPLFNDFSQARSKKKGIKLKGDSQYSQLDSQRGLLSQLSQTQTKFNNVSQVSQLSQFTLPSATSSQPTQLHDRQGPQKRTNFSQTGGSQIKQKKKKKKGGFA